MKKSLTLKMFTTLFLSFALLTSAIIFFLYCYFSFSYRDTKIDRVTNAINEFADDYRDSNWSEYELYQRLSNFNKTNNVSLSVHESGGAFYSEESSVLTRNMIASDQGVQSSYLITLLSDGVYYDMVISSEVNQELQNMFAFSQGSPLEIEGYLYNDNLIIPESVNGYRIDEPVPETLLSGNTDPIMVDFTAEYTSTGVFSNAMSVGNPSEGSLMNEESTSFAAAYVPTAEEQTMSEKNGVAYYVSTIPYTSLEEVYLTKTMEIKERMLTFDAYMSLHSVSEINEIMTSFLPWFLLGSILMAFLISLVYSRTVSRPIIKITETADNMAAMDLDARSEVTRKDELGILSRSLNTLASNLNVAMQELVEKNKRLAEDFAKKELEEESRKAFIANASHELKTPLGVIRGYTEAIKDGVRSDKREYYMDVITDEISRMNKLLEDMMQLSKSEASADRLVIESVSLDEITKEITGKLEPDASLRNLLFHVKSPLGSVTGDRRKLHQAMFNLLVNAVKYASPDSSISIETINVNGINEVYILNECPPFSEEDLVRIWERFYKVDSSHNRESEGSGLGLAIVRSIFEGHGAEYGVYNTKKGVCFYFKLPE